MNAARNSFGCNDKAKPLKTKGNDDNDDDVVKRDDDDTEAIREKNQAGSEFLRDRDGRTLIPRTCIFFYKNKSHL